MLVSGYDSKPLDGPNDLWIHPGGGVYITDPMYRAAWWDPAITRPSQPVRAVYYLKPDLKTLVRVAELNMPNGIVGTPDGRALFVADINVRMVWRFDIQPDGALVNKRLLCNFSADGITLAEKGNLYLVANLDRGGSSGVTVVDTKTGRPIGFIPVPEPPSNPAFGGKNCDVLHITARTGFYSIQSKVRGANAAK